MNSPFQETDRSGPPTRGRKWWMIVGAVIVLLLLLNYKPQRYRDETTTMHLISSLLKQPVMYRRFEGFSTCPYVNYVYLPRADLTEDRIKDLAELLQKLPRLHVVEVSALLEEQRSAVNRLDASLPDPIIVGTSARNSSSGEQVVYVAGLTN